MMGLLESLSLHVRNVMDRKNILNVERYYLSDDGAHGVFANFVLLIAIFAQTTRFVFNAKQITSTCELCNAILSCCLSCSDNLTCLKCEQGYYLTNIDKVKFFFFFLHLK